MGKVIQWELGKEFKFSHTIKWYIHNPESVLGNKTYKVLCDFEIQTNHLMLTREPDLVIVNKKKKTCRIEDLAVPANHRVKPKESEKKDKYLNLARELLKTVEHESDSDTMVIGMFCTVTKGSIKGLEDLEISRRVENIQTTTLLRSARILRGVMETRGDLMSLKL